MAHAGQALSSGCYYYRATMQTDGNLVLTSNGPTRTPYYATGTAGTGGYARMQSGRQLRDLQLGRQPRLGGRDCGNPGARVDMQVDGNMVVYGSSNSPLGASNTPRQIIGTTNCSGSNFALTSVFFRLGRSRRRLRFAHSRSASGKLVRLLLLARLALPGLHVRATGNPECRSGLLVERLVGDLGP